MSAATIARALGAAQRCGQWWRCICPVHGSRSGHSASLALRDGGGGLVVYCHAGCALADILAELGRRGLLGAGAVRPGAPPPAADPRERGRRIALARRIWSMGREARGTPVARYLAGRGLDIEPPPSLRWAPRCWHREARAELPAMLARVDGPDGELIGVHRTYLRRDGSGQWRRRDRASLGPIAGGAVRLAPAGGTLIVGEGIETTLAAVVLMGRPSWAALSTSGLGSLILPATVRTVVIFADRDDNGAGERAARKAGLRWAGEGRHVQLVIPDRIGADANDLLREARHVA
jgi:putative DNA primase/helicase